MSLLMIVLRRLLSQQGALALICHLHCLDHVKMCLKANSGQQQQQQQQVWMRTDFKIIHVHSPFPNRAGGVGGKGGGPLPFPPIPPMTYTTPAMQTTCMWGPASVVLQKLSHIFFITLTRCPFCMCTVCFQIHFISKCVCWLYFCCVSCYRNQNVALDIHAVSYSCCF